jgi:hypothetical protein
MPIGLRIRGDRKGPGFAARFREWQAAGDNLYDTMAGEER